jgi:hypothetical protein
MKINHPWITNKGSSLLKQPFFELTDFKKWNLEMGTFYKRVNETKDERSFVLLMAMVVEFHLDSVIKAFFPKHVILLENLSFTFSLKIDLIKSLVIIPESVITFTDLIRRIRNEFAHNINIDKLEELKENTKGRKLINKLDNLCVQFKDEMTYSNDGNNSYREKFKDIADFANNALREYEPSIALLRNEIEGKEFIDSIYDKYNFKHFSL